jgi:Photoprotection regulator fluorescence recovery protein
MHDIKWTNSEKKLAREVFDAAVQQELSEIIADFKSKAAALSEPDELWSLVKRTDRRRQEIDDKYDFRYSQLLRVFGHLMREGRITEQALTGLSEEKVSIILHIAGL